MPWIRLGIVVAVLLATGGATPTPYEQALMAYRAGHFDDAARILEAALAQGPARAGYASLLGWARFRAGRLVESRAAFERALAADPSSADAWTGLGYVALRDTKTAAAEEAFARAVELSPDNADAWKGLGIVRRREGDRKGADVAYRRALALSPDDAELAGLIRENAPPGEPLEERRPSPRADPSAPLHVVSRAVASHLEARDGDRLRPFFLKGINLGTTLPGSFPADFPDDPVLYRRWFDAMGKAGFNAVRLYTLHPPSLYRALAEHNTAHPDRKLLLVQGVWTELPLDDNYDGAFGEGFVSEIHRVIDAIHGNLELPPRPGHAHGVYDTDLSGDTLAILLGREWEPYSIVAYEKLGPARRSHDGTYVRADAVRPFEAWLASILDEAARYETESYRTQHALAYVSWPTLDPLKHPTEATAEEETKIRVSRGEVLVEPIKEYDNDLVDLDSTHMRVTDAFPSGIFACYHAYPYYPDFMILDPGYSRATDREGPSNYIGYLRDLRRHHGAQPVIIGEFGVPSSRGIAHLQPQGQNHGGHDDVEQGTSDARLFRNVRDAGLGGGILFSWMDEWFKRNWLVMNYESPPERNPLWLNPLDAEQNYGLLGAYPGRDRWKIVIDGRGDDWTGTAALMTSPSGRLRALRATADEAYLYLRLDLDPSGGPIDWSRERFWIGIDTYDASLGDHRLPAPVSAELPIGLEFLVRLEGPTSRVQVDPPYDLFTNRLKRPYQSTPNDDGVFSDIEVYTNRDRFGRDGTYYPARGYDRSPMRHGSMVPGDPDYDSLAEWKADPAGGYIEARIPWGLLNVTDPSSRQVVHETRSTTGVVETTSTDGFRFHVAAIEGRGDHPRIEGLPASPRLELEDYPVFAWDAWQKPSYHLTFKESYGIVRRALQELPTWTDEAQ